MTRPQLVGSCTLRECHELVESKRAVAAHARIGSLTGAIRVDERVDDRALELLAEIERHVRDPEAVTRRSRSRDRRRRAAGTLGVRRSGVLPQAKGHADRVLTRATQRDRAIHPAAHRNGDATGPRFGCEGRSERCCERLDRERLAADRRRFDQVEPVEITIEPAGVGSENHVAVDGEPNRSPRVAARRVSEDLGAHRARLAACPLRAA